MINDALLHLHSNMERFKGMCRRADYAGSDDLHSNMERFKDSSFQSFRYLKRYLHSNMERFKDAFRIFSIPANFIYIPIWRDLKVKFLQCHPFSPSSFTFQYGEI